ncbi:MAG: lysophospholipid acyltransferase family protein [Anaerolineales bacterium]
MPTIVALGWPDRRGGIVTSASPIYNFPFAFRANHLQVLLRAGLRVAFHILATLRVLGRDHLPRRGPYLLAVNHIAFLDAPFVFAMIGGADSAGWAAEKYARHPLYGPFLRLGGGIFIRRGQVDRGALSAALDALARGKIFGVAPEGTRSPDGRLIRGRTGVAYLAYHAGVPVVPAAVTGTERVGADLARLRRPVFTLVIGEPFRLPALDHEARPEDLRRGTDEVMARIAVLLPPAYRGVYEHHPRTQELLGKSAGPASGPSIST